jgi:hypothetical protein
MWRNMAAKQHNQWNSDWLIMILMTLGMRDTRKILITVSGVLNSASVRILA